ncbi:MAG: hypothetical protein K0R17_2713 [Rariglobus sp.]|jgi:hypothetical protein|nr:hypothetical protein [Rariglobus sp.]
MPSLHCLITSLVLTFFASVSFAQVDTVTFKIAVSELRTEVNKAGTVVLLHASLEAMRAASKAGKPTTFRVPFEGFMKSLTGDEASRARAFRITMSKAADGSGLVIYARKENLVVLQKQLAVLEAHQLKWDRVEPTERSRKFKAFALDPAVKMLKEAIAGTSSQAWVETAKQMTFYFDSLTPVAASTP